MNIFVLDNDPTIAAQNCCDRHVIKMVLESAQMLSTCHRINGGIDNPAFYKATHRNHPCTLWLNKSKDNYNWLYQHFISLGEEYTYRYGKIHKSIQKLKDVLANAPANLLSVGLTPFAQAMPEEYKNNDPVLAYRNYYMGAKLHLLEYIKREIPFWLLQTEGVKIEIREVVYVNVKGEEIVRQASCVVFEKKVNI